MKKTFDNLLKHTKDLPPDAFVEIVVDHENGYSLQMTLGDFRELTNPSSILSRFIKSQARKTLIIPEEKDDQWEFIWVGRHIYEDLEALDIYGLNRWEPVLFNPDSKNILFKRKIR